MREAVYFFLFYSCMAAKPHIILFLNLNFHKLQIFNTSHED